MKKLLISVLLLPFFGLCFATYTSTTSEYKTPILTTALDFHASYTDGKVTTSRANIDVITSKTMKRYKVIKSTTNKAPVYPEDGYITAISNRTQINFVETNPSNWSYYYRVCAIMEDMNRYCSNVVELSITKPSSSESPSPSTKPTTSTTSLTSGIKTMIEWLVTAFMAKVDAKYGDIISAKTTFLDTLISKISTLAVGKNAALFNYLKEKLQEQSDILKLQELLHI